MAPNLAECVRCERCLKPELSTAELRDAISRKIRVLKLSSRSFKADLAAMFGGDGAVVKLAGLESDSVTIETLVTRFEQFYDESEVVCGAAAEAFAARDYAELGRLVDESHRLTVEKLGNTICLLYTSPSPRDKRQSRMPSSA